MYEAVGFLPAQWFGTLLSSFGVPEKKPSFAHSLPVWLLYSMLKSFTAVVNKSQRQGLGVAVDY